MRKGLLIIALGLTAVAGQAAADVLAVPEGPPKPEIRLPAKGISMADVEKQFGTPRAKQATVGGDTPKHPPITRWDYDGFAVIFEKDRVVDAVVPGAPPRVFHKEQLQPVAGGAAPMAPPPPAMEATPAAPPEAPAEPVAPGQPAAEAAPADSAAGLAGTAPASPDQTPAEEATPVEPEPAPANVATPDNPNPDRPQPQAP